MKELQLGVLKGYDASMFRDYAPDVKSFMEAKEVPNSVTVCVDKISHPGHSSYKREVEVMKKNVPESEWKNIKITMISPSWYHFRYRNGKAYPKDVYSNDDEYFADVAKAYQEELKILHSEGIRNIQVDDPNLACMYPSLPRACLLHVPGADRHRLLLRGHARGLESRQGQRQDGRRDV